MYTACPATEDFDSGYWYILDLQGDHICTVMSRAEADCLLSHLNRS